MQLFRTHFISCTSTCYLESAVATRRVLLVIIWGNLGLQTTNVIFWTCLGRMMRNLSEFPVNMPISSGTWITSLAHINYSLVWPTRRSPMTRESIRYYKINRTVEIIYSTLKTFGLSTLVEHISLSAISWESHETQSPKLWNMGLLTVICLHTFQDYLEESF